MKDVSKHNFVTYSTVQSDEPIYHQQLLLGSEMSLLHLKNISNSGRLSNDFFCLDETQRIQIFKSFKNHI